jgi:uncharacterized membrane protein/protein-disulfide isomerase
MDETQPIPDTPHPRPLRKAAGEVRPISSGVLWTLRLLAMAGLATALFLIAVHVLAYFRASQVKTGYCNLLGFFDCDTVLNSEWGTWFGVPVPVLGAGAYAVLLAILLRPLHRIPPEKANTTWAWLCTISLAVAGAAGWFIYLQAVVLNRTFCMWCMIEHAIGLALFALIWLHAFATGVLTVPRTAAAAVVAALPLAALVVGQHLDRHIYLRPATLVGQLDDQGRYSEIDDDTARPRALVMMEGMVELDPLKHPVIGTPTAQHIIIEAIDYTCPRCKRLAGLLQEARALLGVDYAVMVITFPLHPACNKYYAQDFQGEVDPKHRSACDLATMAHAVWLADPAKFDAFHHWLFENQDALREDATLARSMAIELVGDEALARGLKEAADQLVGRDVELAVKLGVGALPGLYANNQVFNALPEEADTLALHLRMAFDRRVRDGNQP